MSPFAGTSLLLGERRSLFARQEGGRSIMACDGYAPQRGLALHRKMLLESSAKILLATTEQPPAEAVSTCPEAVYPPSSNAPLWPLRLVRRTPAPLPPLPKPPVPSPS